VSTSILITGATGNIGAKLAVRALQTKEDVHLTLVVRASTPRQAHERLEHALNAVEPDLPMSWTRQVTVVCGDITRARFGLPERAYDDLAHQTTHVIHSAASTGFNLPLAKARTANVLGTLTVMEFARHARRGGMLEGVAHVSTAFVCGRRAGEFSEEDPGDGTDFSNSYERSKWEAEWEVRRLMGELPIAIFRPSIVVGDSRTGRAVHFSALYAPLNPIVAGLVTWLPCSSMALLDVVPVDFVADAILHICLGGRSDGKTYHLVAGSGTSCMVSEVVAHALNRANGRAKGSSAPEIRYLGPDTYESGIDGGRARNRWVREMLCLFEPYINTRVTFTNTRATTALEGTGIAPARLLDYLDTLLDYCFLTNWGRPLQAAA